MAALPSRCEFEDRADIQAQLEAENGGPSLVTNTIEAAEGLEPEVEPAEIHASEPLLLEQSEAVPDNIELSLEDQHNVEQEIPKPTLNLDRLSERLVSAENSHEATCTCSLKLTFEPTAIKHLHPIFKLAKTFEVRRLIKKIKFLR